MDFLLNLLASGLVFGALYGFIAIGFAVIYKTTGVVNFAQGEIMMLVTYFAWTIGSRGTAPWWQLLLIAVVGGMLLGWLIERLLVRPMLGESQFAIIMTTVGIAIIIRGVVPLLWGVESFPVESSLKGMTFEWGPVLLLGDQVFALAVFLTVALAGLIPVRKSQLLFCQSG